MSRRSIVIALAAVLAVAVAVPVLAQDRTVTPRVVKVSQRAMKTSRTALRVSRTAKRQARKAEEIATAAATAPASDPGKAVTGLAAAAATTESEEAFVQLPGGPSVSVAVPASGLIQVWAQATMNEAGAISLFEDGRQMPGQSRLCAGTLPGGALFSGEGLNPTEEDPLTLTTPASLPFCASDGAPAPVLFQTSPGLHLYELRYGSCGCGSGGTSPVTFSQRRLFIAPLP